MGRQGEDRLQEVTGPGNSETAVVCISKLLNRTLSIKAHKCLFSRTVFLIHQELYKNATGIT